MRAVVQRVTRASVQVDNKTVASIGAGLLILLGMRTGDLPSDAAYVAAKCAGLRVFPDHDGKMNVSVSDAGGSVLVVSQFTLYGDTRKGNRPSFGDAADPKEAVKRYEEFLRAMEALVGPARVAHGVFGAMMSVELVNDGPVTLIVESNPTS